MEKSKESPQIPNKREVLKNTFIFSETDDILLEEISRALKELNIIKEKTIIKKGDIVRFVSKRKNNEENI